MKYEDARRDYERLVEIHDGEDVADFTGGFVFEDKAMELMRCPCKRVAKGIYCDLIHYASYSGFENAFAFSDNGAIKRTDEVIEIFERHNCEINPNLSEWK